MYGSMGVPSTTGWVEAYCGLYNWHVAVCTSFTFFKERKKKVVIISFIICLVEPNTVRAIQFNGGG